jgi:hypothetical protein
MPFKRIWVAINGLTVWECRSRYLLGYLDYDESRADVEDMDGRTTVTSRAAAMAVEGNSRGQRCGQ